MNAACRWIVKGWGARFGACLVLAFGLTLPVRQARMAAAGATYYVAPSGADTNDCLSQSTPCLTIGAAVGKTAAGDTVAVAEGSYHERVVIAHDLTLTGAALAPRSSTGPA